MISKDGVITMKNQGKTIWEYSLHKPVVETKINVKNLNFEEENILPGEDGNLYLINSKKEKFTLLNYTIKDIVNNEILTFEKEKKNFFTKKKIIHSFGIDFFSGKKISNPEKQNHNVIFFKEIKYGLQYNYNESLSFWNASLTTFCGTLLGYGVEVDSVVKSCELANNATPDPLPEREVAKTLNSIIDRELAKHT